jgi:PAS domain-containing protein
MAVARVDRASRSAADAPPAAMFSCSLAGTVLAAGAALGGLTGHPLRTVIGAPAHRLLDPSSHAELQQVLHAARDGAASGSATFLLRHARGSCVEVSASWLVLAGDDSTQLVFACTELSVGRTARLRQRMQEAFGRLSREVAVVADAQGVLRYVSPTLGALFGYAADAVVPWDVWSYVHPYDVAHTRAAPRCASGPRPGTGAGSRSWP